ncbi:hypothetical protein BHU72_08920 [Desulfuribacillus stibiiarsenatis]|uniref:GGDEF domain-containing protein n=1 Tax=Desulfuribacillus stibiiarsenatis TaxID=1390249 RepID=A0A1E5L3C9_9FIRM|nr:GGDEF domain-containing protein [Desulfuribacillus stibiiarsenatis]OEH84607.1 hypothetical protein BHU72_08920 [Desulfuribacillus stibiiarsenatis]
MGELEKDKNELEDIRKERQIKQLNDELIQLRDECQRLTHELDKWKEYARKDDMTEILNKREGKKMLNHEIEVARTTGNPLTICFVDIDDLKTINDVLGHMEGDNLILNTARILKENIRKHDVVYRFGGDEFVIIFPNTTHQEAQEVCCRIEKKIEDYNLQSTKFKLNISYGVCQYPTMNMPSITEYIQLADKKMYDMKKKC